MSPRADNSDEGVRAVLADIDLRSKRLIEALHRHRIAVLGVDPGNDILGGKRPTNITVRVARGSITRDETVRFADLGTEARAQLTAEAIAARWAAG